MKGDLRSARQLYSLASDRANMANYSGHIYRARNRRTAIALNETG